MKSSPLPTNRDSAYGPNLTLRLYRMARGMRQVDLAAAAGTTPETVSRAENGRHRPHRATARAIAEALGAPVAEVFGAEQGPE